MVESENNNDSTSSNKKMIKFVCLSDTHTKTDKLVIPKGDVLIHAGDFTSNGSKMAVEKFCKFLGNLTDFKHKIVIAGNHEVTFDEENCEYLNKYFFNVNASNREMVLPPKENKEMLSSVCTYLENSGVNVYGYNIWGSPYTPIFYNWGFMRTEDELAKIWELIPNETDILITHGPPFNILDKCLSGENAGDLNLLKKVCEIEPLYHIFGHIHESNGLIKVGNTTYINASTCNFRYNPTNKIYEFELPDKSENS